MRFHVSTIFTRGQWLNVQPELLEKNNLKSVCSLGLPQKNWASVNPDGAIEHLKMALDKTAEMGCLALSGVNFGGIGERKGVPPTQKYDNIAKAQTAAAKHAKSLGLLFGIEPVNRYENHLINTGWQAVEMIERVGAEYVHSPRCLPHEHQGKGCGQQHSRCAQVYQVHPPLRK